MAEHPSLDSILERWRAGDKTAIEAYLHYPAIRRLRKLLKTRFTKKPIKAGNRFQLCLGVIEQADVAQTVDLILMEIANENLSSTAVELLEILYNTAYYRIMDDLLYQQGYQLTEKGWRKPIIVNQESAKAEAYEMEFKAETDTGYPYGFSEQMWNAIQQLDELERLIVCLYYGERLSMAQVGRELGMSAARVHQILKGMPARGQDGLIDKLKGNVGEVFNATL